jgi:hypothetical protein
MLPTIETECSQFLRESYGFPLLKNLPVEGDGFRKVKVRKKKNLKNDVVEAFNGTFNQHADLMQRSVFAYGRSAFAQVSDITLEPFYIFPTDGYKFLYAEQVSNTTEAYRDTLSKLVETYGEEGIKTFQDVLKYQYTFENLAEGLSSKSEIIIYGIPYYHAVRASLIENYSEFLGNWLNQ